jgi:hypothetical protein
MINLMHSINDPFYINRKCRDKRSHSGQRQQSAIIFQGMVASALGPITITAPVADQFNGQPVLADIVSNLFKGPCITKRRNTVDPDIHTFYRKTCANRHHILFRYPGVNKPISQSLSQRLERVIAKITC